MDSQNKVDITELIKSWFTEEELKKMESEYNEMVGKKSTDGKLTAEEVKAAYSRSIANQNYFDY